MLGAAEARAVRRGAAGGPAPSGDHRRTGSGGPAGLQRGDGPGGLAVGAGAGGGGDGGAGVVLRVAGLGDGEYEMWGEKVKVSNGRTENERGNIAGSVISLADGVKVMRSLGYGFDEIARYTSGTAAEIIGDTKRGTIDAGMRADLVAFDDEGNISDVMIGGRSVK